MRYILSLLAISIILVACEDNVTNSPTVLYRMRGCSDSAHYGNSLRAFTLSDGQSLSIEKGDSCVAFDLKDTSTYVSVIAGDHPYTLIIKSGKYNYLTWDAGSMTKDTAFSDSLKYCKEYTNVVGVTVPCARISPQGFPFQLAN